MKLLTLIAASVLAPLASVLAAETEHVLPGTRELLRQDDVRSRSAMTLSNATSPGRTHLRL